MKHEDPTQQATPAHSPRDNKKENKEMKDKKEKDKTKKDKKERKDNGNAACAFALAATKRPDNRSVRFGDTSFRSFVIDDDCSFIKSSKTRSHDLSHVHIRRNSSS
jgi:hypothetical protein